MAFKTHLYVFQFLGEILWCSNQLQTLVDLYSAFSNFFFFSPRSGRDKKVTVTQTTTQRCKWGKISPSMNGQKCIQMIQDNRALNESDRSVSWLFLNGHKKPNVNVSMFLFYLFNMWKFLNKQASVYMSVWMLDFNGRCLIFLKADKWFTIFTFTITYI